MNTTHPVHKDSQRTVPEIFNSLLEGRTITLAFPTKESLLSFKSQIFTRHARLKKEWLNTGLNIEGSGLDLKILFQRDKSNEPEYYKATISLVPESELPKPTINTEFFIINSGEENTE
jgi:hypothetical protein